METLKEPMRKRPDLLGFDARNPMIVGFDARAAGLSDRVLAMIDQNIGPVADLAANMLKETNPAQHMARMIAIKKAKGD